VGQQLGWFLETTQPFFPGKEAAICWTTPVKIPQRQTGILSGDSKASSPMKKNVMRLQFRLESSAAEKIL
jgi:hypothetical protein